jgi:phage-related protein
MADKQEWSAVFYTTEQGEKPVEDFLYSLDMKTQARFIWSINLLKEQNVRAREPLVKHIAGKLWELRRASNGNIYRVMYFFYWQTNCLCAWISEKDPKNAQTRN